MDAPPFFGRKLPKWRDFSQKVVFRGAFLDGGKKAPQKRRRPPSIPAIGNTQKIILLLFFDVPFIIVSRYFVGEGCLVVAIYLLYS